MKSVKEAFDLTGRVAIITGGAGLLGVKHAEAIAEMGGIPVLLDLNGGKAKADAKEITATFSIQALGLTTDVTQPRAIASALSKTLEAFGRVDILINNVANNPKVEGTGPSDTHWSRLENFSLDVWHQDLAVGLTSAFLCSKIVGSEMARRGRGVIINITSDLAIIAPDQRIYSQPGGAAAGKTSELLCSQGRAAWVDSLLSHILGGQGRASERDIAWWRIHQPRCWLCPAALQPDTAGADGS